jgi:hypothetical protein
VAELLALLDAPTTAVSWPNLAAPKKRDEAAAEQVQTNGVAKSNKGADIVGEF